MNRYVFNSAVVTMPGVYRYEFVGVEAAIKFLRRPGWISTIRYPETASALWEITGIMPDVSNRVMFMVPGDVALVFRLHLPTGTRIRDRDKGSLGVDFILKHSEIGLLKRLE